MKMGGGRVVTGENFWDREAEQAQLKRLVSDGIHVNLFGQRRMGKTSLMRHVADQLTGEYHCIFVDLQHCQECADAIAELSIRAHACKGIGTKIREMFDNIFGKIDTVKAGNFGITLRAGLNEGNWVAKGDQLFDIFAEAGKPVILFIDELPIMVNHLLRDDNLAIDAQGRKRADKFMSWLRKNSLEHQDRVRVIISGSIGIIPLLKQAKLTATVNCFTPMEVRPWSPEAAEGCIRKLAGKYGVKFEDGTAQEMTRLLGCCVPHHVQVFFELIHDRCERRQDKTCTLEDVREVYRTEMLGARAHVELTHYEERLEKVLGKPLCAFAMDMLTETAVSGQLTPEAIKAFEKEYSFEKLSTPEAQKEILGILEHDGYLRQTAKGYRFVSRYLRDWWKNRHRLGFDKVLERKA